MRKPETKVIDWPKLIELMSIKPASILGLAKGTLSRGADADITIIDPKGAYTVDIDSFRSKGRNCPWHGWQLKGRATHTIVAGEVRYQLDA